MSIRLAITTDAEAIKDIYQASITSIPERLDLNAKQRAFWLNSGANVSDWETIINSENQKVFVYENNGSVVGFASIRDNIVRYLYVHPNNSGSGIAFSLLEHIENYAKGININPLLAEVTPWATHLFITRGYVKVDEFGKLIPNTAPFIFVRMKKDLVKAVDINRADVPQPEII